ncbi:hypothetical protein BJ508DRAFT_347697 [Ascobolus immersus RN42]|uniref:Band 7 domain-containing protein n=1 Tax=Ascobolus immersus RN42 TaxID=1160509 RepID=A0A3N4IQN0_ASCIM|nr:hypothetical protein BJ508DRAFT_347697 [Ascobolus immersus RN42]
MQFFNKLCRNAVAFLAFAVAAQCALHHDPTVFGDQNGVDPLSRTSSPTLAPTGNATNWACGGFADSPPKRWIWSRLFGSDRKLSDFPTFDFPDLHQEGPVRYGTIVTFEIAPPFFWGSFWDRFTIKANYTCADASQGYSNGIALDPLSPLRKEIMDGLVETIDLERRLFLWQYLDEMESRLNTTLILEGWKVYRNDDTLRQFALSIAKLDHWDHTSDVVERQQPLVRQEDRMEQTRREHLQAAEMRDRREKQRREEERLEGENKYWRDVEQHAMLLNNAQRMEEARVRAAVNNARRREEARASEAHHWQARSQNQPVAYYDGHSDPQPVVVQYAPVQHVPAEPIPVQQRPRDRGRSRAAAPAAPAVAAPAYEAPPPPYEAVPAYVAPPANNAAPRANEAPQSNNIPSPYGQDAVWWDYWR